MMREMEEKLEGLEQPLLPGRQQPWHCFFEFCLQISSYGGVVFPDDKKNCVRRSVTTCRLVKSNFF